MPDNSQPLKVKIDRRLLTEYVGLKSTGPESDAFHEIVRRELDAYSDRKAMFDGRPSANLKQLLRLKRIWQKTDKSARLMIQGLLVEPSGWARPEIDLSAFETNLDGAIHDLQWTTHGRSARQRSTELARNETARNIAAIFKNHYRLKKKEYRLNLDGFIRRLFHSNGLSYPDTHDDSKQRDNYLRSLRLI